ncbi:hypothetical protein [Tsukamurella sp. 1534]|uniref:hypothetical protein n=1 Tax=Tsukamurella sp. 1534 TaxID=1151061 RepID=UPI0002DD719E|nr:hypothetical protein [Tsukamurella sp. 1534]
MAGHESLRAQLIIPPDRAATYLRAMDIEVSAIHRAVAAGDRAAATMSADPYAPAFASGMSRWIAVVSTLRRSLAETGLWVPDERSNQPISRHLRSGRTLAVFSGDPATGNAENAFGPRAVHRKGAATARSLEPEEPLISLESLLPARPTATAALTGAWVLLYRDIGGAVRLEVSQPTGFDRDEGQYTGWAVRVILDEWSPGDQAHPPLFPALAIDFQAGGVAA